MRWMVASLSGRDFYKNDPAGYEAVAKVFLGREEVAKSIRRVIDSLNDHPKHLAVDAACGTGIVTHELAGSAQTVIGLDQCDEALAFARASKDPSLQFDHGDLHDFSRFQPGSIDLFSMAFACRFIQDLRKFYADLALSLANDGMAIISTVGHAKRLKMIEDRSREAGLVMDVVRPKFRALFNRMHGTAHVILRPE